MQRIQEHEGLFEFLEPRLLLSGTQYVVDSLLDVVADDGVVTLREAIEAANTNTAVTGDVLAGSDSEVDAITFDAGLFSGGTETILLGGSELSVTDELSIVGPWSGLLVIDGGGLSRVFHISSLTEIDGVTIRGGVAAGQGGGIYVNESTLHLIDSVVTDNTVTGSGNYFGGAGIYSYEGTVTLTGSTVSGNVADVETDKGGGGGIYNYKGTLTLADSSVSDNWTSFKGGGIFSYYGDITITGGAISDNTSTGIGGYAVGGGGMHSQGTTVMLTDVTVSGNTANGYGGGVHLIKDATVLINGGAISDNSGFVGGGIYGRSTLTGVLVSGNKASLDGGGTFGPIVLSDCTVTSNSAGGKGGGINDCIKVERSTISGNWAGENGGGLYSPGSVINSVVVGNHGGGISGGYQIVNSTVVSNEGVGINMSDSSYAYLNNSIVSLNSGDDVVWDNGGSNNLIGLDPGFVHNPDDGGDGWGDDPATTDVDESVNDDYGDLHLGASSTAINTGDNTLAVDLEGNLLGSDIEGNIRFASGTVDIGAYERQSQPLPGGDEPLAVVTTHSDIVDAADGWISLREALLYDRLHDLGGVITFSTEVIGQTIVLSGTELLIEHNVTIDASAVSGVTIDANGSSRVMNISSAATDVTLNSLTLTGGYIDTENGAGIYLAGGTLTLVDSTVTGNTGDNHNGGGIFNHAGTLIVQNSVVSENEGFYGGGIYNYEGTVIAENSTFLRNHANSGGGIIDKDGVLKVTNSKISGNTAINVGGGIYSQSSEIITLSGSIMAGNTSGYSGSGIFIDSHSLAIISNCTIVSNSANTDGAGGIHVANGNLTIYNSIVAMNEAPGSTENPDIPYGYQGSNNLVGVDPIFYRNPSKGADRHWGTADDDYGDLHLLEVSIQAINQGNNLLATDASGSPLEFDLDGNARIYNGIVDIGAYESPFGDDEDPGNEPPTSGTLYVVNSLEDVIADDGMVTLFEALEAANTNTAVTGDVQAGSDEYSDMIVFNPNLFISGSQTFNEYKSIQIRDELVLRGPGRELFTIWGSVNIPWDVGTVEISGLTVRGGGVSNRGDDTKINNIKITECYGYTGTALTNYGNIVMTNCSVTGNDWSGWGNEIYGPPPVFAISSGGGKLTMVECLVANNVGEGIYVTGGEVRILNSTIYEGIENKSTGSTILAGSTLSSVDGSAIINRGGTTKVISSKITHSDRGLYVTGGSATVSNSVIANNSGETKGGGIYVDDGVQMLVTNSTIVSNSVNNDGGGIFVNSGGDLTINNSIVWNNKASGMASEISGSYSGTANLIGVDPLFKGSNDYRLKPDSGAIDQGDNSLAVGLFGGPLLADIAGMTRIANGNVDIGAYEYASAAVIPGDFNLNYRYDAGDIDLMFANMGRPMYDLDGDFDCDQDDVDVLIHELLGTEYGDANLDGEVGLLDLDILGRNYNKTSGMGWAEGDFNGGGSVTLLDLDILGSNWGASSSMSAAESSAALWWTMDGGKDDGFDALAEVPTLLLDEEEEIVTLF